MECPECGTTIDDEPEACPECGADLLASKHRVRRVRAGFALALIAAFLAVFAVALLLPAGPGSLLPGSKAPTGSVETTRDPVRAAIEKTIAGFYATVDAGDSVTVSPYVYSKGLGGVVPAQAESSATPTATPNATTTFTIARAVVGSGTAEVYGRESRSVITTTSAEVEFRLKRVSGKWLISSWQVAREATMAPEALSLSDPTARDIVGTVLEAHQVGDAATLRMLTTERFQLRHSSWFDGADQSELLLSYRITDARPDRKRYAVTVYEEWLPTPLTTTYTVVMTGGEILVDAWAWK